MTWTTERASSLNGKLFKQPWEMRREGEKSLFKNEAQWRAVSLEWIFYPPLPLSPLTLSFFITLCFWQDRFCSNRMSAFCWGVSRPWPQPQSQPLTPTETNHRSRLPSSHGSPALTASRLNLRCSSVGISLDIHSLFITLLHSSSSVFFNLGSFSLHRLPHGLYNLFSRSTCPAAWCSCSRSQLHWPFFLFALNLFISALMLHTILLLPHPATYRHIFSQSCNPVFYISAAAATQCKHYSHAGTRALSIRRGL